MATQRSLKGGSPTWGEETSPDSPLRRAQQVSPRSGRKLPGMPMNADDADDDAPRPRQRFGEERKGRWWRPTSRLGKWVLAAGVVTALGGLAGGYVMAAHALERDSRFRIAGTANIDATGLGEVSRTDLLPVFGEDIGKNIFFIHLGERRKQLEQIPWVEHATVMRLLPDQIRVSIVERKPVAFVREGQQIELVDANGVLLSMSPTAMAQHHYSFPVLTGIDSRDTLAGRRERMAVYQRLVGDLDSSGQHLSEQISEIDLTDPEDARVLMPEQGADILAHFGDDQFLTRYERYKAHIAEWRAQYPKLASVDLRYDQQVVLQMAGGGTGQAVNADGSAPAAPLAATHEARPAATHEAKPSAAAHAVKKTAPVHKAHPVLTAAEKRKLAERAALLRRARQSHHTARQEQ